MHEGISLLCGLKIQTYNPLKQGLQHFKASNFHTYNKQSIVYNKNKHESKFRPKSLELYINSIKNTPTPSITII